MYAEGIALLDETMPSFQRDGRISHVPDHLRLRAELLIAHEPDARDAAVALLTDAIDTARSHRARSFELRAALSAARLLSARGRAHDARALVGAAYSGFTEGFDDPDLREARAFLA
jgi:predicted ATPase